MIKNTKSSLTILFENDAMIAVEKPAGIIVIPDQYTEPASTLTGMVSEMKNSKMWTVHRIDRDTTGVLLFAKNAESHAFLCRQFEEGSVHKTYFAILNGAVRDEEGVIDRPILIDGRRVSIDSRGKPSKTRYRVIERFRDFTFVQAEPETGRRHQLRVHFWSIGHPLAVDPEHGGRSSLCLSEFKKKYKPSGEERPLMGRLSLHAARITFNDPATQQPVTVESPLPDDFEITLKQLRKHNKA